MSVHISEAALATLPFREPAYQEDPYPTLSELRKRSPFAKANLGILGDTYVALRYQHVMTIFRDERFSADPRNRRNAPNLDRWWVPRGVQLLANSMLNRDDPSHHRLRNLVQKAFTPHFVKKLESEVDRITCVLIENCAKQRVCDIVKEFALPLPLLIISHMLGVPESDRLRFHGTMAKIVEGYFDTPVAALKQLPNTRRMTNFLDQLIATRRKHPDDGLLTALIGAEEAGDRLNADELVAMIFLLLIAGYETSANLIGNGVLTLLDHPDQLAQLKQRPELLDTAIDELLRFEGPVHFPIARAAREDLEIGGFVLRKGESLLGLLASAHRDEEIFPDADRFDITRTPNRHLGFGMGIHFCLGAPLARLEGKLAFSRLFERFPDMRLAVPRKDVHWHMSAGFRGLRSLPVSLRS